MNDTDTYDLDSLRDQLLRLTYIYSYQKGSFILTTGRKSSYYIDGKQVTMSPEGLCATASFILASLLEQTGAVDAVGGLTLGADPISAAVSVLSRTRPEYVPLSCFIVRKEAKKHGTGARIEGPFYRGLRTVIVDDVLTSGLSVLSAASAVEEAGGSVEAIYVLVDRMEGGREAVTRAGYTLKAIVSRTELEALQLRMEQLYPGLFESLQSEVPCWPEIPWPEAAQDHPLLTGRLEQLGARLTGLQQRGGLEQSEARKAARDILRGVKAAALHPSGVKEALRLLEKAEILL